MAIQIPLAITSTRPRRYWLTQGYHSAHLALDMVGQRDQPVLAAESGTVFAARWDGRGWGIGGGNCIILDHHGPGSRRAKTVYAHLARMAVTEGQYVLRGQVIGWANSTGRSTGDHVHFGVGEADGDPALYHSYRWHDPRRYMRGHSYENGYQRDGDRILSLHLRNSVLAKPDSNLRSGAGTGYPIRHTTTTRELTAYLGSVTGGLWGGSRTWDKLWHPKGGVVYLHTNLGEWVL